MPVSVPQQARPLQATLAQLPWWLPYLFNQWEELGCKARVEMDKGGRYGGKSFSSVSASAFSLGELSVSVLPLTSAHLTVVDLVGNCWWLSEAMDLRGIGWVTEAAAAETAAAHYLRGCWTCSEYDARLCPYDLLPFVAPALQVVAASCSHWSLVFITPSLASFAFKFLWSQLLVLAAPIIWHH